MDSRCLFALSCPCLASELALTEAAGDVILRKQVVFVTSSAQLIFGSGLLLVAWSFLLSATKSYPIRGNARRKLDELYLSVPVCNRAIKYRFLAYRTCGSPLGISVETPWKTVIGLFRDRESASLSSCSVGCLSLPRNSCVAPPPQGEGRPCEVTGTLHKPLNATPKKLQGVRKRNQIAADTDSRKA